MEDRENYPLWINIKFEHNHALNRAELFKFLSVEDETKQHFLFIYLEHIQLNVLDVKAHLTGHSCPNHLPLHLSWPMARCVPVQLSNNPQPRF